MNKKMQFSLIFACFNEEEELRQAVEESIEALTLLFEQFEIIIVDDCSIDKSPKIADALAKKYPSVKVIHNPINLGQGISFLIGIKQSQGEYIMQNGVDRPFAMQDLKKLIPLIKKNDILIIARTDRSAYSLWRKCTSLVNIFLRKIFFNVPFSDLNFVQIYKKSIINTIVVKSRSAAFVTQELIITAYEKGYRIHEIKLPYYRRKSGETHHGKQRDILWALIDMLSFWLETRFTFREKKVNVK